MIFVLCVNVSEVRLTAVDGIYHRVGHVLELGRDNNIVVIPLFRKGSSIQLIHNLKQSHIRSTYNNHFPVAIDHQIDVTIA